MYAHSGALKASVHWKLPFDKLTYDDDNKQYDSQIRLKETETEQFKAQANEEITKVMIKIEMGKAQIEIVKETLALITETLNESIAQQNPLKFFSHNSFTLKHKWTI